ncbi:DEBR0S2_14488g1_1 [Brettanomyces bruxellensis]|uniref:DEBR0S2_14488g1_1 n=2 Tax=Dekkera bruxellensis TaxID=5007 RepID=A0A7D9CWX2_DEKBR|nr:DEBR0S2_14488g1_1 [Brettanomyces bruxellensis]
MEVEQIYGKALDLGSREFRHGNFSKALKIYARGISIGDTRNKKEGTYKTHKHYSNKYKTLVDCRSACFQKLELFDRALDDSNFLISIDKYGTKGYLRKAKILCLTGNQKAALTTLHYAAKRIQMGMQKYGKQLRVNKKLFGQLLEERSRLAEKLNFIIIANSEGKEHLKRIESKTDFVSIFPLEVISEVIRYLDQKDILSGLTVSHAWNQAFTSLPQALKFPKLVKPISRKRFAKFMQFCNAVFENSCSHRFIDKLEIIPVRNDELSVFSQLSEASIRISHLSLSLRVIDNLKLLKLLDSNDDMRKLFGLLDFFALQMPLVEDQRGISYLLSYLLNCKALMLNLSGTRFSNSSENDNMKMVLPNLKRLYLNMIYPARAQRQDNSGIMRQIFQYVDMPSLVSIDLTDCVVINSDLVKAFNPGLKVLKLRRIPRLTVSSITMVLEDIGCKLESFSFIQDDLEHIVPETMQNMDLSIFENLRVLELEKTYITAVGLTKLLESTHGLLEKVSLASNGQLAFGYGPLSNRLLTTFSILPYHNFVACCPNLVSLSLVQCCNLDDHSISTLSKEIIDQGQPQNLKELDLSYNNLTSRALTFLFNRYSWLKLAILKVNGIYLSEEEVTFLTTRGFCTKIECRPVA